MIFKGSQATCAYRTSPKDCTQYRAPRLQVRCINELLAFILFERKTAFTVLSINNLTTAKVKFFPTRSKMGGFLKM